MQGPSGGSPQQYRSHSPPGALGELGAPSAWRDFCELGVSRCSVAAIALLLAPLGAASLRIEQRCAPRAPVA